VGERGAWGLRWVGLGSSPLLFFSAIAEIHQESKAGYAHKEQDQKQRHAIHRYPSFSIISHRPGKPQGMMLRSPVIGITVGQVGMLKGIME